MIATKDSLEPQSSDRLPNSTRIYVPGQIHPDLRVPFREIRLSPTKGLEGRLEANESVRVYDCSGPWGDPDFTGDVTQGLPRLREAWIRARGDVEENDGRKTSPRANGYLSGAPAETSSRRSHSSISPLRAPATAGRRPLRASKGHPVS